MFALSAIFDQAVIPVIRTSFIIFVKITKED